MGPGTRGRPNPARPIGSHAPAGYDRTHSRRSPRAARATLPAALRTSRQPLSSERILLHELVPTELGLVVVLAPVRNEPVTHAYDDDAMRLATVLERELTHADLAAHVERDVVPNHLHRGLPPLLATEELEEPLATSVLLFRGRLRVDG